MATFRPSNLLRRCYNWLAYFKTPFLPSQVNLLKNQAFIVLGNPFSQHFLRVISRYHASFLNWMLIIDCNFRRQQSVAFEQLKLPEVRNLFSCEWNFTKCLSSASHPNILRNLLCVFYWVSGFRFIDRSEYIFYAFEVMCCKSIRLLSMFECDKLSDFKVNFSRKN